MYKLIFIIIFSNSLFSGNISYSLQIATFKDFNKASAYKKRISNKLDTFLYKTDSGYWTVRFGQEKSKNKAYKLKNKFNFKCLKKAIAVPTSLLKIIKRVKKPKVKKCKKKLITNMQKNFFEKTMISLKEDRPKISTYTFQIVLHSRIYMIQFTNSKFSKRADEIFNEKPNKLSDVVILSNDMIHLYVDIQNVKQSAEEIEKIILPILNKSRKSKTMRVKAYRINL